MGKKRSAKKIVVLKRVKRFKLVFDTNIWVSLALNKLLTESFRTIIVDRERFAIYMSDQMVSELARVLTYPRITRILEESKVDPRSALASIIKRVYLRSVTEGTISEVNSDEPDNRILECAVDSRADFIVSGDPHLLKLQEFLGIKIITAKEFREEVEKIDKNVLSAIANYESFAGRKKVKRATASWV